MLNNLKCNGFHSFDNVLPRKAFGSEERDEEMGYYQMGRRLYDPAIGRFMAVDPLFESFPSQSPYNYAFNSPMQWRDPSGLAPQKEKRRDRILYTLLDMETWANVVNKIDAEYQAFMAYIDSELDGMNPTEEERGRYWKKWGKGESNNNAVNNGQRGIKVVNHKDKETFISSVEDYYEDLITFDENDIVTFKDKELASKVAKNDPKSNFAKLFTLATNLEELFVIEGVKYDQPLKDFQKGMSGNVVDYLKWSLKDICEKEYIVSTLTGQFLPSNNKGKINMLWSKDDLNNTYYCNQYQGFDIGGSLAHELYFHAYLFLLYKNESSLPFWHPTNYHMTQSSEYINALKKKK